jgi:hypothetical protein
MKKTILALSVVSTIILSACGSDASVASRNLATAADAFELQRRVVFYNGITGDYMLTVEGKCSIEPSSAKLKVTCKHADNDFRIHTLGLSDNVTYFAEQLDPLDVSVYHTRIIWKPQSIIPNIDINGSSDDLIKSLTK